MQRQGQVSVPPKGSPTDAELLEGAFEFFGPFHKIEVKWQLPGEMHKGIKIRGWKWWGVLALHTSPFLLVFASRLIDRSIALQINSQFIGRPEADKNVRVREPPTISTPYISTSLSISSKHANTYQKHFDNIWTRHGKPLKTSAQTKKKPWGSMGAR